MENEARPASPLPVDHAGDENDVIAGLHLLVRPADEARDRALQQGHAAGADAPRDAAEAIFAG